MNFSRRVFNISPLSFHNRSLREQDEAEPKGRTGHLRLGRAPRRYVRARSVACMHCDTGHAVQIEPRLRSRSPENGNISNIRRRLSAISLRDWPNSASRDRPQFAKARHWRAFLRLLRVKSPVAALPGWRRSADRTRLHANSLLTGNFTGNFAGSRASRPMSEQETSVLQSLLKQFPTQTNRENILRNREFFGR